MLGLGIDLFRFGGGSPTIDATGGTITKVGGYKIHTFTSSGTFTVVSAPDGSEVEYLVVAGGGGGSSGGASLGGGGAGGYRSSVVGESSGGGASAESKLAISAGSYTVTVGSGGAPVTNGTNSVFGPITSIGGGGAGIFDSNGLSGGSGGGAGMTTLSSGTYIGGAGTVGQGFAGGNTTRVNPDYSGGGGGGAGSVGTNASPGVPGNGGAGVASSITGSSVTYASGGQGVADPGSVLGTGVAGNGATNTGEGGGSRVYNLTTYSGGSGIVVIRYAI